VLACLTDQWLLTFPVCLSIDGVEYRRRSLVIWAANKGGGAHVADEIPPNYARVRAEGALGSLIDARGIKNIKDAHYVFLRTMAGEVLHSPELLALTE